MKILRQNQKEALKYSLRVQHPALFMEMRLGKTITTIRRVKQYQDCCLKLIFCPYEAMLSWEDELTTENQEFKLIIGSGKQREAFLRSIDIKKPYWYITNHQAHLSIGNLLPEIPWDVVILDESSCIRHPETSITKFFTENFRNTKHRFILTGLPAPESDLDYFCQLKFLDSTVFNESNYYEFMHNNFGKIGYEVLPSPEGSRYIANCLAKHCIFQSRDDYNLGGIVVHERRFVKMPSKAMKLYTEVERSMILRYKGSEEQTIYQPVKRIWLRRICGGFAGENLVSSAKADELKYLLSSELKKEQVIICAFFTDELRFLKKFLKKFSCGMIHGKVSQMRRRETIKKFRSKFLRVLLVQPECLRYGANLSFCDTIITYSLPEKSETYHQFLARIVDTSSDKASLIVHLLMEDTLESSMLESLIRKEGRSLRMKRESKRLSKKYL